MSRKVGVNSFEVALAAPSPAVREAAKPFPRRMTLDLTEDDHRALKVRAAEEGVAMADLLRGLVKLYLKDGDLASRVKA